MAEHKFKKQRKSSSRIAVVTALAVVAIVLLVNIFFSVLEKRENLRFDFTKDKHFSLSAETETFLAGLEGDVEIIVLARESDFLTNTSTSGYTPLTNEILRKIENASDRITLSYVDLLENPDYLQKYAKHDVRSGDILVVAGEESKYLPILSLLGTTQYADSEEYVYINSSKAEAVVLSAIRTVLSEEHVKVGMIRGFGDDKINSTAFEALLSYNSYDVVDVDLIVEKISPEIDILVLTSPLMDLTKEQIGKIETFLDNDGKLGKTILYLASPLQEHTENIDAFLKDWGVEVGDLIVLETDSARLFNPSEPFISVVEIAENLFTTDTIERGGGVVLPLSLPVNIVYERQGNRSTFPLLYFPQTAVLFDKEAEIPEMGPFVAGVVSSKVGGGEESDVSYVITVGSVDSIGEQFINSSSFANSSFYMELFGRIYGTEEEIIIEDKVLDPAILNMTGAQVQFLEIIFIVILPAAVLILGLTEWVMRRRR